LRKRPTSIPFCKKLAEDFVSSRRPDLAGILQEIEQGTPVARDTRLVARQYLSYRLKEDGNEVTLLFGGSRLTLPAAAAAPLRFALAGASFRVNDLPGRRDEAGKVVLARRLLREGLLLRSD
jgi:hypothetical protein